jgi:hypothetical protein
MQTLILFIALVASSQEGWWNSEWTFRRKIAVKNNLEGDLKSGYAVQIEFDAEYLGIQEKAKKDFTDLVVTHGGKRIPSTLLPGRSKGCRILCFRTATDLRGGARDEGYALYYGNAAATEEPASRDAIFDFYEDFSDPESFRKKFAVDKDVAASVQDGALVIRDVPAGRTEDTPARLVVKALPGAPGFSLTFDLEIDSTNANAPGFAVNVDLKSPGTDDAAVAKKADELIDKLGDLDWETREKATKDLIRLGRPVVPKLIEATRSSDAEVKWRAEHILKQIRENSPLPVISAGVMGADATVGPVALTSVIGKNRGKVRYGGGWPAKLKVTVLRDPDGDVTILWNNGKPQTGHLPGDVREISFSLWKGSAGPLGTIKIDNIVLKRHVDDDSRPTHTLEVEEKRP